MAVYELSAEVENDLFEIWSTIAARTTLRSPNGLKMNSAALPASLARDTGDVTFPAGCASGRYGIT